MNWYYDKPMRTKTVGELIKVISCILVAFLLLLLVHGHIHSGTAEKNADERVAAQHDLIKLARAVEVREGWKGEDGAEGEVGPLQITDIMLEDFENHHTFLKIDRTSWGDSLKVFTWAMKHYGVDKGIPFDQLPRIWNGGPQGCKKLSTLEYSEFVMEIYNDG